jgi:hypothetical protein
MFSVLILSILVLEQSELVKNLEADMNHEAHRNNSCGQPSNLKLMLEIEVRLKGQNHVYKYKSH